MCHYPHFSLYLNGEVHGFFAGARGLRQGSVSPYLFVLVMEVLHMNLQQFIEQDGDFAYHWKCKDLGLFQLSFADDLLLLFKAEVRFISLFRRGLDVFASLSGLHTNPQKSQLIISKAAHGIRTSLLDTLGFLEGHLPMQYLGLPLISSRLTISDCQPLFQRIDSRIHGWEGTNLSFAGRVQLIKSVLLALGVYWAMAFLLPEGVIKEINKRLPLFFRRGLLRADILRTSIWVDWITHYRLRDKSVWTVSTTTGAWGWRKMLTLRNTLLPHIQFKVGSGDSISLCHDPWHRLGPLILAFPRGPQLTQTTPHALLNVVIENGSWRWPLITDIACLEITRLLPPIHHGNDSITWTTQGGAFNTKAAYDLFRPSRPKVDFLGLTWSGSEELRGQRHVGEAIKRPPSIVASNVIEEVKQRILSTSLRFSISTQGLYRLWHIPWPVKGNDD
ncbi:hypothetical protein Sango_2979000 [Sesamum angolense]|uniref:Reverse transcriptase domain-containing protein n=1 Tax=Sesamum angolense TaxID=2727404 RepID=A0AAE1T503_9LAMI|nr:hypothetical protein Sango_2979000 [Sesamum angolense]